MKAEVKIPRGYRRVYRGIVHAGDFTLSISPDEIDDAMEWRLQKYDLSETVPDFHCVIRKIRKAKP